MRRNPPRIPPDTDPEAWQVQMAAIAARTPAERLTEWKALNDGVNAMQERAIRRRYPEYSDAHVRFALLRARYGDDIVAEAWPEAPPTRR